MVKTNNAAKGFCSLNTILFTCSVILQIMSSFSHSVCSVYALVNTYRYGNVSTETENITSQKIEMLMILSPSFSIGTVANSEGCFGLIISETDYFFVQDALKCENYSHCIHIVWNKMCAHTQTHTHISCQDNTDSLLTTCTLDSQASEVGAVPTFSCRFPVNPVTYWALFIKQSSVKCNKNKQKTTKT